MLWFTADTHFGHEKIIGYCDRPFSSVEEMDEAIIAAWNERVGENDTVYHLGDFTFRTDAGRYLDRLNGRIFLVEGSHDKETVKGYRGRFERVAPIMDIRHEHQHVVLCHYAMRVWPRSHYGAWHLYGHSHGCLPAHGFSFDVGVDGRSCDAEPFGAPYSWDEVVLFMDAEEGP